MASAWSGPSDAGRSDPITVELTGAGRQRHVRFAGYLSSAAASITSLYLNGSTRLDTDTAREEAINFKDLTVCGGAAQHSWPQMGRNSISPNSRRGGESRPCRAWRD